MGLSGLEPPTSRLSGARSNLLSYKPISQVCFASFTLHSILFECCAGGDDGIRTHDPLLAGQVLSQLSYTPIGVCMFFVFQRSEEFDNPSKLNNKQNLYFSNLVVLGYDSILEIALPLSRQQRISKKFSL